MRFHLKVMLFLPVTATLALAQFGVPLDRDESRAQPAHVREVVAQYCRLDYDGARLEPDAWPKMQSVAAWRTNPDFPLFNVIYRFTVDQEPVENHGKYEVTAHYRLVGRFTIGEGLSKDVANTTEDVNFTVAEVNGVWRVTDVDPNYPHPSRAAALKWLQEHLAKAQDEASKTIYQHAISELQPPASPPAPAQ